MRKVYVIGTACTPFGKHEDQSFQDLARWAYADLLRDSDWTPTARS
jgi:acetyl-CoA acetyltransferase